MPVKQITDWTVFGEIQTATTTFIARLTRFSWISHPFENLHGIPTGPWGFITVPIPIPYPAYPWESPYPSRNLHTRGNPQTHDILHVRRCDALTQSCAWVHFLWPNPTHGPTQPMDNSALTPLLWFVVQLVSTVVQQLTRFRLTQRIVRSVYDSTASCHNDKPYSTFSRHWPCWDAQCGNDTLCGFFLCTLLITRMATLLWSGFSSIGSTLWVKKTRHLTLAHNFTKYWPIFKILSLLDSVGNL